jgi:hypothetical protein
MERFWETGPGKPLILLDPQRTMVFPRVRAKVLIVAPARRESRHPPPRRMRLGKAITGPEAYAAFRFAPLRGLPLSNDLPEVGCQFVVVTGKDLIQGPLGTFRGLLGPLFALGGFALVFLYFALKISLHDTTPRNNENNLR